MKVSPYLYFNGNCTEAIAFYEKAFNVKAEVIHEGTENLVSHGEFEIGGYSIFLCDTIQPMPPVTIGDNTMIAIRFNESEKTVIQSAFDTLKEDGNLIMELEETSWSKCFGLLIDKFGVKWNMCQSL